MLSRCLIGFAVSLLLIQAGAAETPARLVKDFAPETEPSSLNVEPPVMAGGKAFFRATTLEHGAELWVASGQGPGRMIADINPGSGSSMPDHLMEMDGILYFSADDGVHGNELWRSDGTEQGTYRLIDIRPGLSGSDPKPLAAAPGKLWFSARTLNSYELWCTDGRADNTLKLPAGLSERSFFLPRVTHSWETHFTLELAQISGSRTARWRALHQSKPSIKAPLHQSRKWLSAGTRSILWSRVT
jgi:ELWxxDGT repeat protein